MNDPKLRNRLLAQETVTPELEAKYREGMKAILERPLTPVLRIGWIIATAMGIGFFVLFSTVAVRVWPEPGFPVLGKMMFSIGALFGLLWAIVGFTIVKRGSASLGLWRNPTIRQLQTMPPVVAGMTWGFCVLITVFCQMMGSDMADVARGNQMILGGIIAMVLFGIPVLIMGHDTKSDILLREKFLELELELADIRELIAGERAGKSGDKREEPEA